MEHAPRKTAPVLASHLYDFVTCEHRIALDAQLDKSERTPPDEETKLLFKHGLRFERKIAGDLGYPEVTVEPGRWLEARDETIEHMRSGVDGIYQGVLIDGRCLAQPDFLDRVPGRSDFGDFLYAPGDAKSALHARSDAALQVGFAAVLLERLQGVFPERGFLILGDGSKEWFEIASIRATLDEVMERVADVADGREDTFPFFSAECGRCRWRGKCLPELQGRRDLSFTYGLTRTRADVFRRHGIESVDDLAQADREKLKRAGAPTDGLERIRGQAQALLSGRVERRGIPDLPEDSRGGFHLHLEADPLDLGAPFLFCCGGIGEDRDGVRLARNDEERSVAFLEIVDRIEKSVPADSPVFHYGSMTLRGLDFMGERLRLEPGRLGKLEGRLVDLAPPVRRSAVLPVHFYSFEEVAAVALNEPRPDPAAGQPAPFLAFNTLLYGGGDEGIAGRLTEYGRECLRRLDGIRAWLERLDRGVVR